MARKKAKISWTAAELAAMDEGDRFEAMQTMKFAARAVYIAVLEKCKAAQAAYPKLYLLDECVSRENASDGLFSNEGHKLPGYESDYAAVDYEYLMRNLEADTGFRMADAGLDPNEYGIRF